MSLLLRYELAKRHLACFLNYVYDNEEVNYGRINLNKSEANSRPAYSEQDYVCLARMLFNEDYITENRLVEKAIENHFYAETWMFLSLFFVCGWRAGSICKHWVYPYISEENHWNINIHSLREDILNRKIPDDVYSDITTYSIKKIELMNVGPDKTAASNPPKLRAAILPDLRPFFGRIALIAEYHRISIDDGYMQANRISEYCNWVRLRYFFGEEYIETFGRNNIETRRLNKSYLQDEVEASQELGYSPLKAHVIASFSRNHKNIDTTIAYLKDHGLTGETAELVLYMMLQRGVFGSSLYIALLEAFPETFPKLTKEEQTYIMEQIPISAYELEVCGKPHFAGVQLVEHVKKGDSKQAIDILKAMYEVGNNRGQGKEPGVYCRLRAMGYTCEHAPYESCIANVCEHHIFTKEALPSLVKVIIEYEQKYKETGNQKYKEILTQIIKPTFTDAINYILATMNEETRRNTKKFIGELLNAES